MSNVRFNFGGTRQQGMDLGEGGTLLYISSAKYGEDWHSLPHTHQCTELFYVLSGGGRFIVEEKNFSVKTDDLVIVNPNVQHTEVSFPKSPLEYIVLGVGGVRFDPSAENGEVRYSCYNFREYKNDILFYLHSLLKEVELKEDGYELVCQNFLQILMVNIGRRSNDKIFVSYGNISRECAAIKQFIDEHYKENLTLDSLAKTMHMNKYYLVHSFNRYLGTSPINYMIERRIEESKNLLSSTDFSILQISTIMGFSSQSYFSQAFKKSTGLSPNQYRKQEVKRKEVL